MDSNFLCLRMTEDLEWILPVTVGVLNSNRN